MSTSNKPKSKREKRLETVLRELTDAVGWNVFGALSEIEIRHSYSSLIKPYNKAQRLLLNIHDT